MPKSEEEFYTEADDLTQYLRRRAQEEVEEREGYRSRIHEVSSADIARSRYASGHANQAQRSGMFSSVKARIGWAGVYAAVSYVLDPKTWSAFHANYQNRGLAEALKVLLGEVTALCGLACISGFSVTYIVSYIEDLAQRYHPGVWETLSPNVSSAMAGAAGGAVVTIFIEAARYAYYQIVKRTTNDTATKGKVEVRQRDILSVDNIIRHLISLGTNAFLAVLMSSSIWGLLASFVICQLALLIVEDVLERKNAAGGWKEWVRPVFAGFGIMAQAADIDRAWDTDGNEPITMTCSLSTSLFVEPMVDKYGDVYERRHIMRWLLAHPTSPLNRSPLVAADLKRCPEMERLVREYVAQHGLHLVQ